MAAAKKKRRTKRSVKKKTTKPKKPLIEECEGYKLGDKVWATYLEKKVIQGTISQFHPDDSHGPVATIITPNQGYRSVLIVSMSYTPITKKR
tara:strand:- start:58 stop:333 length:276 start_codon:yes stop_codon:yes gene_type:complete